MPKKVASKALALGSRSSSGQAQATAAAAAKPVATRLGPKDLRSPSDKFEQTLEQTSIEEFVQRACTGKISPKIQL
ncbi:hypothetical protein GUJ93_ZPchr0012g21883 [Zizania palustris]|uniref:Uncharacterized protein n=1 Tax=Zizania palustris TaxID=103762 RepID=A0A8J6BZR7_ZIZPA|nr:hypothetical protein GUJ93_ZPchr0012g21883 [Zizania palustris]